MAIALDQNTNGGTAKSYSANAGTGSKRILFVFVRSANSNSDDVSAVTWNGESLTLIGKKISGTTNDKYIYMFACYPIGTGSHNTVITSSLSTVEGSCTLVYTDVAQTGMPKNFTFTTGRVFSNGPVSLPISTTASTDWLIGVCGEYGANICDVGTNTTSRLNSPTQWNVADSNGVSSPTALNFTFNYNDQYYAIMGCSISILNSIAYPLTCTTGTYTLTGNNTLFHAVRNFICQTGTYIITGYNITFNVIRKWVVQSKNTSSETLQSLNTSSWTNETKDDSTLTNQTKQ